MTIANRVVNYLVEQDADYDVIAHPHSSSSLETAQLAHVRGDLIAKSVVLEDERGYLLAVLPASCRVDLGELHRQTKRPLALATEAELGALFGDCELGGLVVGGRVPVAVNFATDSEDARYHSILLATLMAGA